jgi:hypothetical protein
MASANPMACALCIPMGSRGAKSWGHARCFHGDRVRSCWRGWRRRPILLCVVRCVLCVVYCVLCVVCSVFCVLCCVLCVVCCVLCVVCCVLCAVCCLLCVVCCVLCVVCCVLCVVCCVLCVVCCVLCAVCCALCVVMFFLVFVIAHCRVEYPKLGKYSPQQKLGTNEPPKDAKHMWILDWMRQVFACSQ